MTAATSSVQLPIIQPSANPEPRHNRSNNSVNNHSSTTSAIKAGISTLALTGALATGIAAAVYGIKANSLNKQCMNSNPWAKIFGINCTKLFANRQQQFFDFLNRIISTPGSRIIDQGGDVEACLPIPADSWQGTPERPCSPSIFPISAANMTLDDLQNLIISAYKRFQQSNPFHSEADFDQYVGPNQGGSLLAQYALMEEASHDSSTVQHQYQLAKTLGITAAALFVVGLVGLCSIRGLRSQQIAIQPVANHTNNIQLTSVTISASTPTNGLPASGLPTIVLQPDQSVLFGQRTENTDANSTTQPQTNLLSRDAINSNSMV